MTKQLTYVNEPLKSIKSLSLDGAKDGGGSYILSFVEPKNPYFSGGFMVFGVGQSTSSFSLSNLSFRESVTTKSVIQIHGGKMRIEKSLFMGNHSAAGCGALSISSGLSDVVMLIDTSFEHNTLRGTGGAIVMRDYKNMLTIHSLKDDVKFQGNRHSVDLNHCRREANAIMMNSSSLSLHAAVGRMIQFYDGIIGLGVLAKGDTCQNKGASRILINGDHLEPSSIGVVRFEETAEIRNAYIKLQTGTLSLAKESFFYAVPEESTTLNNNVLSLQGGGLGYSNKSSGILRTSTLELFHSALIRLDAGDKCVTHTLSAREGPW